MKPINERHPIDVHVGKAIYAFRVQAGLSQVQLAERLGVSFQQLQKYESGANRVSASRLFELAEILNEPVASFFPSREAREDDPDLDRWICTYHTIPEAKRTSLLKIARLIIGEAFPST